MQWQNWYQNTQSEMIIMYTLLKKIMEIANTAPDRTAICLKEKQVSYGELCKLVVLCGNKLKKMGLKNGDRVVLSAVSKPELFVIYLGVQYAKGVAVFLDKNATMETASYICEDTNAFICFTNKKIESVNYNACSLKTFYNEICDLDEMVDISAEMNIYSIPDENALAEMIFTTGTTGKPKGVMLSYKAVYSIMMNTIEGIGMDKDERVLVPLPLNHSFALRVVRSVLYLGGMVVLQNGIGFGMEVLKNQEMYDCTGIVLVTASLDILEGQMQERFSEIMGRFKYIEVSAGNLPINWRKKLTQMLPNTVIHNTWGSSESGGALFLNVTDAINNNKHVMATGHPLPSVQICTLNEEREPFESCKEHPGRLALKGDMVMLGYWNRPELNKEMFVDDWLITSDMVYTDSDGYVYMLGRADDIINVGGEKVSPIEIETVACEFEGIKECACIGVEDKKGSMGFVSVLFVVSNKAIFSEDELKKFLSTKLERYKIPNYYKIISKLPRNAMEKIDRKILKKIWDDENESNLINPVIQTIFSRRTIRNFTEKKIPEYELKMILKAGYMAPTGHNMQTWRFTVLTDKYKIENLKETSFETAKKNNVYFYGFNNPAAIIIISNDERNPYGCQDASAAAENIFLAAWSYGIGSVWLNPLMTLRNEEPIKGLLDMYGIPNNHKIWCMVGLGYPATEGKLLAKNENVIKFV